MSLEPEVQQYLDGLAQRFENRMSTLERELSELRRNPFGITETQARDIFRSATLTVNTWTRIAVAVIAALTVIGNGTANVIVDHNESKASARYELITDRKLAVIESHNSDRDEALIQKAITERDARIEALIVKEKP